jgi:hypothetical protein
VHAKSQSAVSETTKLIGSSERARVKVSERKKRKRDSALGFALLDVGRRGLNLFLVLVNLLLQPCLKLLHNINQHEQTSTQHPNIPTPHIGRQASHS